MCSFTSSTKKQSIANPESLIKRTMWTEMVPCVQMGYMQMCGAGRSEAVGWRWAEEAEKNKAKTGSQAEEERVLHPLGSLVPRPGQGGREGGEGGGAHGGTLPNLERVQITLATSINIITEISALIWNGTHGLGQWDNHTNRNVYTLIYRLKKNSKLHSKPQIEHGAVAVEFDCTYTRRKGLQGEAARLGTHTVCSGMIVFHAWAGLIHGHGSASAGRGPSLRLLWVRQAVGALPFQIAVLILQGVQLETKQTHSRTRLCL